MTQSLRRPKEKPSRSGEQSSPAVGIKEEKTPSLGSSNLPILFLIIKELNITILAQPALLQVLALLLQNILQRDILIREDLQMVADQMPVLAPGTRDERGAEVVGLFGDAVRGALETGSAGEGHFVRGLLGFARGDLLRVLRVGLAVGEWAGS